MKLIRCHIEHFGCLSEMDFTFEDGLTVLCQPNGFGKSTLAAFLKAMFYGFPRTAKRSVRDNERKKYLPWQGGKYGGFLIFSHQGTEYRVTRFFGATAAKDTFSLYDMTHRRESRQFSSALGEELFRLDADSYARSTYMPQLQGNVLYSTTDIQTKLSNLVEDTNDINNFDSAMDRLKKKRSEYRAFRGDGGTVGTLQSEIYQLQKNLEQGKTWQQQLQQTGQELEHLRKERDHQRDTLDILQKKIKVQSTRDADRSRQEQHRTLQKRVKSIQDQLQNLDQRYPNGYPAQAEADTFRDTTDGFRATDRQIRQLSNPEQERQLLQREAPYFTKDRDVQQDIRQGRALYAELGKIQARLSQNSLTPEETEELSRLQEQFQAGIPDADTLNDYLQKATSLSGKNNSYAGARLSEQDAADLQQLEAFFHGVPPTEEELAAYNDAEQKITRLTADMAAQNLSEQDLARLQKLRLMFADSLPEAEEIALYQQKCQTIDELEGKKNAQTTLTRQVANPAGRKSVLPLVCAAAGIVLVVLGAIGFAFSRMAPGGAGLACGIVLLAAAAWLNTRQMLSRSETATITTSAISEGELQQLYALKHQVSEFLMRYYPDSTHPQSKLAQLSADCDAFRQLTQRAQQSAAQQAELEKQRDALYQTVTALFQRYYGEEAYQPGRGADLHNKAAEYRLLSQQAQKYKKQREQLQSEIHALSEALRQFLAPYTADLNPETYSQALMELRSSSIRLRDLQKRRDGVQAVLAESSGEQEKLQKQLDDLLARYQAAQPGVEYSACLDQLDRRWQAFQHAGELVKTYQDTLETLTERKNQYAQSIRAFLKQYAFEEDFSQLLQHLNADLRDHQRLLSGYEQAQEELRLFEQQNQQLSETPPAEEEENLPDVETLQHSQQKVMDAMNQTDRQLSACRERYAGLQQSLEQVPAWQDQLEQDQADLQTAVQKSDLLDETMELLSQAREQLSTNYVGRVEQSFLKYANSLLGDEYGSFALDHDLNITLETNGAVHSLEYFSAGSIDCMMLCMHLALVDTLFGSEAPCLVLDDPFVNLDDEHTRRALAMLTTLAKTHQILYLVCNTSRCTANVSGHAHGQTKTNPTKNRSIR